MRPPAQVLAEVDALQPLGEDVLRDAARPLVEIAQDDLRPRHAPIVNERGELGGLVAPLEQRRAQMDVVEMQRVIVERQVDALHAAVLARFPRQIVLHVMAHRKPAEHDVAEQRRAQVARRRHDPAHAERGAEFGGLSGLERAGADHFLERDDVGIDHREHARDAFDAGAAVEAAGAMNVVGGDAYLTRALRLIRH